MIRIGCRLDKLRHLALQILGSIVSKGALVPLRAFCYHTDRSSPRIYLTIAKDVLIKWLYEHVLKDSPIFTIWQVSHQRMFYTLVYFIKSIENRSCRLPYLVMIMSDQKRINLILSCQTFR